MIEAERQLRALIKIILWDGKRGWTNSSCQRRYNDGDDGGGGGGGGGGGAWVQMQVRSFYEN